MPQLRRIVAVLVLLALPPACKDKAAPSEQTAPLRKNKAEAFQVFDKHRESYLRCEKLQREVQPKTSAVESKPAAVGDALALQRCQMEYWKAMKRDMGPYDQAEVDEWYGEWRKGVKIE